MLISGANTYTGLTTVSSGTLALSGSGTLGNTAGSVTVSGGILNLGTLTRTRTGTVALTGGAINNGTLNQTGGNFDLQSGSASAILGGSAGGSKTTGGTVTLSGANTYQGGTTISAGTLALSGSGTLGDAAGAVTVSGGVLDLGTLTRTRTGTVALTGGAINNGTLNQTGGNFDLQSGSASAILGGTAGAAKTTGGTVTLSGANALSGRHDDQRGHAGPQWQRHAGRRGRQCNGLRRNP